MTGFCISELGLQRADHAMVDILRVCHFDSVVGDPVVNGTGRYAPRFRSNAQETMMSVLLFDGTNTFPINACMDIRSNSVASGSGDTDDVSYPNDINNSSVAASAGPNNILTSATCTPAMLPVVVPFN